MITIELLSPQKYRELKAVIPELETIGEVSGNGDRTVQFEDKAAYVFYNYGNLHVIRNDKKFSTDACEYLEIKLT